MTLDPDSVKTELGLEIDYTHISKGTSDVKQMERNQKVHYFLTHGTM